MTLNIEVPSALEERLRKRAEFDGVPVESIVLDALADKLNGDDPAHQPHYSTEEFSTWLKSWAARFPAPSHQIDDSRDSIYSGCGE